MKVQLKFTGALYVLLFAITLSCGRNDKSSNKQNTSTGSYIKYSVNGSAVNGLFKIEIPEGFITGPAGSDGNSGVVGDVYAKDSDEGFIDRVEMVYTTWGATSDNYSEVKLFLPGHIGPLELGEVETDDHGKVDDYPTYYMTFRFLKQDAFYDGNNDGHNDILSYLLSKSLTATITEIEGTPGTPGIPALIHIKGSFEGTAYFTAYSGLPSGPTELLHTVTGEFEYNIPID